MNFVDHVCIFLFLILSVSDSPVDPVGKISKCRKQQYRPDIVDDIDQEIAESIHEVVPSILEGRSQSFKEVRIAWRIYLGFRYRDVQSGICRQQVVVLDLRFVTLDLILQVGKTGFDAHEVPIVSAFS